MNRSPMALLAGLTLWLSMPGCDAAREPRRYDERVGRVHEVHADIGEFIIAESSGPFAGDAPTLTTCAITNDSELYLNDRYAGLADLAVGDVVTMYGYLDAQGREPAPGEAGAAAAPTMRFVLALAHAARPELRSSPGRPLIAPAPD